MPSVSDDIAGSIRERLLLSRAGSRHLRRRHHRKVTVLASRKRVSPIYTALRLLPDLRIAPSPAA